MPENWSFIGLSILLCQSVLRSQVFPNISLMETNDICRICSATILCRTRRGTKTLKNRKNYEAHLFQEISPLFEREVLKKKLLGVFKISTKSFLSHGMFSLLLNLLLRQVPHHISLVDGPAHLYSWGSNDCNLKILHSSTPWGLSGRQRIVLLSQNSSFQNFMEKLFYKNSLTQTCSTQKCLNHVWCTFGKWN